MTFQPLISHKKNGNNNRVVELFAGVGGFRTGLERSGWNVVWSNQWEPGAKKQHASECYTLRFGVDGHVCQDIEKVLDDVESGQALLPDHELLVGGFPCQDYSVAKSLSQAVGIEGKKGVLWWQIYRLLTLKKPPFVLLENVDRLLKSPANQRGRDFAIILACFASLGYSVEWRVVNAADYGFPQKRRRVFIFASRSPLGFHEKPISCLTEDGVLVRALPARDSNNDNLFCSSSSDDAVYDFLLSSEIYDISEKFGSGLSRSPFQNAGFMRERMVWTRELVPDYHGENTNLGDILQDEDSIPEEYFVKVEQLEQWKYLKGAKREERKHKDSDTVYYYTEGALPFPDPLDRPSRTILTGEGGITPSRFKHIIGLPDGRYRRLTPVELERLNGFDDDWTNTGMPDGRRAFCMGNALVVGIVEMIGKSVYEIASLLGRDDVKDENEKRDKEKILTSTAGAAT